MRRTLPGLLTAAMLAIAACDSGPSGPGSFTAVASAPSLGGVVLEVRGGGIRGFTARGASRVYAAAVPDRPTTHRVIVISPEPGDLTFDIEVGDRGMEGPTVQVVQAANGVNQSIPRTSVTVRVQR